MEGQTMTKDDLQSLAARLEIGADLGPEDVEAFASSVSAAFPDRPIWRGSKEATLGSTDALLCLMAEALPSWSVHISGQSATIDGRWTCTIRETGVRDDDEVIGVGKGESLPRAVAAAMLKTIQLRARSG
jgi:hypothetical protein